MYVWRGAEGEGGGEGDSDDGEAGEGDGEAEGEEARGRAEAEEVSSVACGVGGSGGESTSGSTTAARRTSHGDDDEEDEEGGEAEEEAAEREEEDEEEGDGEDKDRPLRSCTPSAAVRCGRRLPCEPCRRLRAAPALDSGCVEGAGSGATASAEGAVADEEATRGAFSRTLAARPWRQRKMDEEEEETEMRSCRG